ncbi:hypothetical protein GCM10020331_050060 [Ectobacillus funiculus]
MCCSIIQLFKNKLITNVLRIAEQYGMRDVHFDFEDVAATDREAYNQFLRNVKARLPQGYTLSTTLVPKKPVRLKPDDIMKGWIIKRTERLSIL